jgi:hypothetical protein
VKYFSKGALAILLLAVCAAAMAAPNVVGHWTGKVHVDISKLPPQVQKNPKAIEQIKTMIPKLSISLTLKADKTYTATALGLPASQKGDKTDTGTYTITGNTLKMTSKNKKKMGQTPPLTIAANGNKMTMGGAMGGEVVFTRG